MKRILIPSGERVAFCGKTGTGKTTLAKRLTASISRLIVCDSKGSLLDWKLEAWNRDTIRKLQAGDPVRVRVTLEIDEDESKWAEVFRLAYNVGDVTIFIDEMFGIVPPNTQAPKELHACYTRGREFGVGVWAATQRPVSVPLVMLTEAEHFFVFKLQSPNDRKRVAEYTTPELGDTIREKHGFYYYNSDEDEPIYYPERNSTK